MRPKFRTIPQVHLGIRFRSTTEARWAQFFNANGIPFIYEPSAVAVGKVGYLPDFQFPGTERPTFAEVKPYRPGWKEFNKMVMLAQGMQAHVFLLMGPPSPVCEVRKVYSDGSDQQWWFSFAGDGTAFLVDFPRDWKHALPLNKCNLKPLISAQHALQAAANFQFDDPLAIRRVRASPSLLKSRMVMETPEVLPNDDLASLIKRRVS